MPAPEGFYEHAKAAGYSDEEIADYIGQKAGLVGPAGQAQGRLANAGVALGGSAVRGLDARATAIDSPIGSVDPINRFLGQAGAVPANPMAGQPENPAPPLHPKTISIMSRNGQPMEIPIDETRGIADSPTERAAIMGLGISNDDLARIYGAAGHEIVREENGRPLAIDRRNRVAIPIFNEHRFSPADVAVPTIMAATTTLAGGPKSWLADAAEGVPGVGPALATGMRFVGNRILGRAASAGLGQFATEEAIRGGARAATGVPFPMDTAGAAKRAATTAAVQAGTEGLGYGLARAGGVSKQAASETAAQPVLMGKGGGRVGQMFERPASVPFSGTPNLDVANQIGDRINAAFKTLTPGRLATEDIMKQAEGAGAKVDIRPLLRSIRANTPAQPVGRVQQSIASRMEDLHNSVTARLRPKGQPNGAIRTMVSPKEADDIAHAIDDEFTSARGDMKDSPYANRVKSVYMAHKDAFYKALPGTRDAAQQTKSQIDAIRDLADRAADVKNPESFVKTMFGPDGPNRESNFAALREAEKYLGTGHDLEMAVRRVSNKAEWTASDQGLIHGLVNGLARLGRPAAKLINVTSKVPGAYVATRPNRLTPKTYQPSGNTTGGQNEPQ